MFPSAYLRKADTLKAKQIIDKSESISVKEPVGRKISRNLSKYAPPRRDVSKPKPVSSSPSCPTNFVEYVLCCLSSRFGSDTVAMSR